MPQHGERAILTLAVSKHRPHDYPSSGLSGTTTLDVLARVE